MVSSNGFSTDPTDDHPEADDYPEVDDYSDVDELDSVAADVTAELELSDRRRQTASASPDLGSPGRAAPEPPEQVGLDLQGVPPIVGGPVDLTGDGPLDSKPLGVPPFETGALAAPAPRVGQPDSDRPAPERSGVMWPEGDQGADGAGGRPDGLTDDGHPVAARTGWFAAVRDEQTEPGPTAPPRDPDADGAPLVDGPEPWRPPSDRTSSSPLIGPRSHPTTVASEDRPPAPPPAPIEPEAVGHPVDQVAIRKVGGFNFLSARRWSGWSSSCSMATRWRSARR